MTLFYNYYQFSARCKLSGVFGDTQNGGDVDANSEKDKPNAIPAASTTYFADSTTNTAASTASPPISTTYKMDSTTSLSVSTRWNPYLK
jgi:hypothetical protein